MQEQSPHEEDFLIHSTRRSQLRGTALGGRSSSLRDQAREDDIVGIDSEHRLEQ